jgi:hypothetical protein
VAEAEDGSSVRAERIAGLDTSVAHPARVYDYWPSDFAPEGIVSAHGGVARKASA